MTPGARVELLLANPDTGRCDVVSGTVRAVEGRLVDVSTPRGSRLLTVDDVDGHARRVELAKLQETHFKARPPGKAS